MQKPEFKLCAVDDDGYDYEMEIPCHWGVCPNCDGNGSHVNRAIDGNGLTAEDFAEDPDFRQDYMSGVYDVACDECKGRRVVPTPNDDLAPKEREALNAQYDYLAELAQENRLRSMGVQF